MNNVMRIMQPHGDVGAGIARAAKMRDLVLSSARSTLFPTFPQQGLPQTSLLLSQAMRYNRV